MPTSTSLLGHVLDLRPDQPHIEDLPAAVDEVLRGYQLLCVKYDTADSYPKINYSRDRVSYGQHVHLKGEGGLCQLVIPVGLWLDPLFSPVTFDGRAYWTRVEVGVDHVKVNRPYLFHDRPQRVDWLSYLFMRQQPIER